MSVSISGELAFEIHIPNAHLYTAYLALRAAGAPLGMRLFGSRAVESMRLEKGCFIGKAALQIRQAEGRAANWFACMSQLMPRPPMVAHR